MALFGELYECEEFFNEETFNIKESKYYNYDFKDVEELLDNSVDPVLVESEDINLMNKNNNDDDDNKSYIKNIEIDIKENFDKISTRYLFLYINKYKEMYIKNMKGLYEVDFYDIHLKGDKKTILTSDNNIIEYCMENLLNKNNSPDDNYNDNKSVDSDNMNINKNESYPIDSDKKEKEKRVYDLFCIYEIILKYFPYSFKLWYHYIKDSIEMITDVYYLNKKNYKYINKIFDKCILYMYNFKSIYIMYIQFLYIQRNIKKIRKIFNLSLQNVYLNQHNDLWEYILLFNEKINNKVINYEYIKRYVTIYPEQIIHLFKHYIKYKMYKNAMITFFYILNSEDNFDLGQFSKYDIYEEIYKLLNTKGTLNNDIIHLLKKNLYIFKNYESITSIYILLANNFIYDGRWNKAMDSYEEGISECYTVNDFITLFDNYIEMLKMLIDLNIYEQEEREKDILNKTLKKKNNNNKKKKKKKKNTLHDDNNNNDDDNNNDNNNDDDNHNNLGVDANLIIDLYMDKINYLLDQRKTYIADIKLKNNKNNVYIWLNKIDSIINEEEKIYLYDECLKYFETNDYIGKLSDIYISYAYYYYNKDEYTNCINIFKLALKQNVFFKSANEIANIFCAWIEVELLEKNYKEALNIARLSIDINKKSYNVLYKSSTSILPYEDKLLNNNMKNNYHTNFNLLSCMKLVSLIIDMEINYGTVETTLNMFDFLYHSKCITVKIVLTLSTYLYEKKYFNESFKVYEKALSVFHYPYVYPIYVNYINKYIQRYKDKNISYVRDLFKQAIYGNDNKTFIPKEFAKQIFLMYANFEGNYGFIKRELSIYKEAIPFLEESDKIKFYKIFISKVSRAYGIQKAREAFEEAIQTLSDDSARQLCMIYIDMEYKLNEYERVRALYIYTAQYTNPLIYVDFYKDWREFEALHGNENTFREMIRIKKSVLNIFSNSRNNMEDEKQQKANMDELENTKRKLKEIIEKEEEHQKKLKRNELYNY
ncbi:pre-mRNA-splicing factor SYF1, putative [Plasmodium sp. gorilla clade G2]|uniref:pre-mRNA-splicing factor SYF1, putative n=1 Tax=Plasmodium sp. gorilla clade G2 TaxID=880535 RepID=UPI000D2235E4|nr:pre-mRNA-splicing factor SYF1, putative [Plasmodium sp. gorilla clade G2]SOV17005.1 pre-mRNA-splicing factor SYF1, putative [Plasmodium sp. gorilla clade G2]